MQRRAFAFVIAALFSVALVSVAAGQDWPCWRGPNHDGISPEKGFMTKWDSPPAKIWQREIGSAFSGLSCVGGKTYTCGTSDKKQVLFCLNADTGDLIWQTPIEDEYRERQGGDGARATPTIDDGRVYVLGALGTLLCCNAEDGKEVWQTKFTGQPRWGYAGSVLIEGDLAIATAGNDKGAGGGLIAFDKKTGKEVWQSPPAAAGYSTPYPFTMGDHRYVVGLLAKEAIIVDAKTGKQLWSVPWVTDWDVNAATPIFHDGDLFLSSGYKTGSGVFKLARKDDTITGENAWETMPNKVILGKFQTPVLWQGFLYVGDEKALKCVEFATGKEKWTADLPNATVIVADGHLVVFTEKGELQIAKASPEKYEPTAKAELLDGRCWTIPTLYKGRLYVRNFKGAACFDLKGK
jgi:outer membrane protein assembly factor BamB